MAVPSYHVTDADSSDSGASYTQDGPGKLVMDADAFLVADSDTMVLSDGPWTVTINGIITESSSEEGLAVFIGGTSEESFPGTSVTLGATAEISGYNGLGAEGNLTNRGQIIATGSDAFAVREADTDTIKNSGAISSAKDGIVFSEQFSGTHTIVNSGTIQAPFVIQDHSSSIEHVTNSGLMDGAIDLGPDNDSFTDFGKVAVGGKTVTHQGTVTGLIDLGDGNDHFTGGNNAETVTDGNGADVYKLGGGNDTFIATGAVGSDGTDTVDGGAGVDLYDASAAAGAIAVNLDTKTHAGIAGGTAILNDTPDKVSNFENVNGGAGADTIYGNAAANHIEGGSHGSDQLFGLTGNDVLDGGAGGGSILVGGAGRDIMTGDSASGDGSGSAGHLGDTFAFLSLSDSGTTASTRDEITDFHEGDDTIDLSTIDAIPSTSGHDDFHFIGENRWDGEAGALRYVWTETQTIVEADVNGDRKMDFSIALDGHIGLAADDFAGVDPGATPPPPTAPSGNHITDANSGIYGATPYKALQSGTLTMDADAWLISAASTIVLDGKWAATINGMVISSDFSGHGGNAAIDLESTDSSFHSSLSFGATAEIDGFFWGVLAGHPTDVTNKGNIDSASSVGFGIREGDGTYTINNSGSILSGGTAIDLTLGGSGSGTHTIINSGTITAPIAINADTETTKLTNTGTINGDVYLPKGSITNGGVINGDVIFSPFDNGIFSDFAKVKVGGKTATHQGSVTGTIFFADADNLHFNGSNNAETVSDGAGTGIYKLAGGNDIFIAKSGHDVVDGGAGRDTFDASAASGAVTVNLDTKAHGGTAANSATFSFDTGQGLAQADDKVTNFEDVKGGSQSDTIYGSSAANHIEGGDGQDMLYGLGGNDVLEGGADKDTLVGGAGRDIMTGDVSSESGGQAFSDTFVYTALSDSGITASTRDEITDFSQGMFGDVIDLSAIDANTKLSGLQEFHFIAESKWDGEAGALRYVFTATQTIIEADVNGDKKMDFSIALDGHIALTVNDFHGAVLAF